jgi:hypothetical protein
LFYFNEMKPFESGSNSQNERSVNHKFRFTPARDSRKRKVRGLWIRNGRYYLQMRVEGERSARKIPLESRNLEAAIKEIREKQAAKDKGELPTAGLKPSLPNTARVIWTFSRQSRIAASARAQSNVNGLHSSVGWRHWDMCALTK